MRDDQRTSPGNVPIVYDQWVELVATFDLDNSCASVTYGGSNIGNGPLFVAPGWNPGTGPRQIANLDLYTVGATSFWDNITLSRISDGPFFELNSAAASADINGIQGTSCGFAESRVPFGQSVNVNLILAAASPGHEGIIDIGNPIPRGSPGALEIAPGQILNLDIFGATRFFLYGGAVPAFPPHPGGQTTLTFTASISPLNASLQYFEFDFASPVGFELTQPCNLRTP